MHFLNWGEWGSRPGTATPYSNAPSAQWPAGSGIEYLFSAGLWVGAIRNGVPAVSTAAFENEFRPKQDPRDRVYRTVQGARNGRTYPSPRADDDGDGTVDEDYLDGYDNDNDGLIDEDFGAVSSQMMTCTYRDNMPVARQIYPQHNPLNLFVRQESYQWDGDRFDDFIGIRYDITNVGDDILQDIYVGMFVDGDAGRRDRSRYWEDDLVGFASVPIVCTDLEPVAFDLAYTYDADGDDGDVTGRFGVMFLDHPTDERELEAPYDVGITTFAYFSGRQTYSFGGDPTNDFERYELMASNKRQRVPDQPRDYRMLVSSGPFYELLPGETMTIEMAFVAGEGNEGIVANAANAMSAYNGSWFDIDGFRKTGVEGQETLVVGPATSVWQDSCRKQKSQFDSGCDIERIDNDRFLKPLPYLPPGQHIWVNSDCVRECWRKFGCGYLEEDSLKFRTGVAGREHQVHWILTSPPPGPRMRIDDHARDGVVVYWDDFSESTPDPKTQLIDFEGYQVWRADNWTRPLGTSENTGPPEELWGALLQVDIINQFGEDTGIDQLRYEPLVHSMSAADKRHYLDDMEDFLSQNPNADPPCPPGVSIDECDTLRALARYDLGLPEGRHYYRYADKSVHVGRPYFYGVVAFDHTPEAISGVPGLQPGSAGDPSANFLFVEPRGAAQAYGKYDENEIYVVPNPATGQSMAGWALAPNNEDPTGLKIEFRNMPPARGTIRVYTIAGDLVKEIYFDAVANGGSVRWDLVSRNGQDIASGVYIYAIEFEGGQYDRVIKKFTVIR